MNKIILTALALLILCCGFTFMRLQAIEARLVSQEKKIPAYDQVVEIIEDCMEFNTFGECKQRYPQYAEQFR